MALPDHYMVLGVPPEASTEEIKSAFRSAALRLHPDKADKAAPGGNDRSASDDRYLRVQQAWDVLGDPQARIEYDAQLKIAAVRQQVQVNERVAVLDMESCCVDGIACISWPCRCGGAYIVLQEEANNVSGEEEVLIPCSTCSLYIAIYGKP